MFPRSNPTASCFHLHTLALVHFRRHLQKCTHAISARLAANTRSSGRYPPLTSSLNRIQEISGTGPAIFNYIQLVILFELFTKSPQNCCKQFWRIRVQQRGLHFSIHPMISQTSFPLSAKKFSKAILVLQLFVKQPVVLLSYSLDSDCIILMFHLHTCPRMKHVVDSFANLLIMGSLYAANLPGCS